MATTGLTLSPPFARGDAAGALRTVLLVPPCDELSRVRPLPGEPNAITERVREQFAVFEGRLAAAGVKTLAFDDPAGAALSPFVADAAVMFADGAFLMRPSDVRARAAVASLEAYFTAQGIPIVGRIEAPGLLDGADVVVSNDTLYVGVPRARQAETGHGFLGRGNDLGRRQLEAFAQKRNLFVREVAIAGEVRRLRSVFAFVDTNAALVASGLVDTTPLDRFERIDVPRGEDLAAGVLTLAPRRVLANLRFRESLPLMRKAKLVVDAIDLWEFGKIGATPGSMVLALKHA